MIAANTSGMTYHLDNLEISEGLKKLKELGFKNLEIGYHHPLDELKEYKKDFNFISYHHFTEMNLDSDPELLREDFRRPVKICNELGIELLSFHPQFESDRSKAIRNLSKLENMLPQDLCIENFPADKKGFLLSSPGDFEAIKKACNDIGILLDVSHISPGDYEGYMKLENYVKKVHLQDSFPELDMEHLPLGAGDMDFGFLKSFVDKPWILELKYGGVELLEITKVKAENLKENLKDKN